ncbi:hypothetical protein M427DRAFT_54127 [Gonapodya prolifera JEL478]|uniref:Uncharacterized protein n=1 Tax=Gonapodya prolifera (strain JEL478) TaxID=1344416 RepID=A0A139AME7_GONPJ|nr:hypothetical protein M427DRAFT_54127 [Gonapodya prolifera JEL478]|eukprot:KXS17878.1 hypothetical protein M427DRAFT_54127 [Gonapodya prolifera JEL478]
MPITGRSTAGNPPCHCPSPSSTDRYAVLPHLSRRMRSAAGWAVPGCLEGEVGLKCTSIAKEGMSAVYSRVSDAQPMELKVSHMPPLETVRFLSRFENGHCVNYSTADFVWLACSAYVSVTPQDVDHNGGDVETAIWAMISGDKGREVSLLDGRHLKLSVVQLSVCDDLGWFPPGDHRVEIIQRLRHFANTPQLGLTRLQLFSALSLELGQLGLFVANEPWSTLTEVDIMAVGVGGSLPRDTYCDRNSQVIAFILQSLPHLRVYGAPFGLD